MANEEKKLVEIENLRKYFPIKGTPGPGVQAVLRCGKRGGVHRRGVDDGADLRVFLIDQLVELPGAAGARATFAFAAADQCELVRRDGRAVGVEMLDEVPDRARFFLARQGVDRSTDGIQPGGGKKFENKFQRQIILHRRETVFAQKAGEIGGRRIRNVQLCHWRDQ